MEKHILLITTLFIVGCLFDNHKGSAHPNLNIDGSNYVNISNFSYNVAVMRGLTLLGGGALITQRFVLTAASVTHGFNASDLTVRLGSNYTYKGGQLMAVMEVFEHPDYDTDLTNNLSILKLHWWVSPEIAKRATPASIPFQGTTVGNITGYGRTGGADNGELQLLGLNFYENSYCNYWYTCDIKGPMLCTHNSYKTPDIGDIGDPLVECYATNKCSVVGICSSLYHYCSWTHDYAVAYVNVGSFFKWIQNITKI